MFVYFKTVIRLLITLAVLNAVYRGGTAASSYYQLKDAAQQLILFGRNVPTAQITYLIRDKALDLGVPLEAANINVSRDENQTFAYVFYTQPVEFFPNFVYPVDLWFSVESVAVDVITPDAILK